MIEFREKHWYNRKADNEDAAGGNTDYPDFEKTSTYNFYN